MLDDPVDPPWTPGRSQTESHERVLRALTETQQAHGGEGVYLDEITRT